MARYAWIGLSLPGAAAAFVPSYTFDYTHAPPAPSLASPTPASLEQLLMEFHNLLITCRLVLGSDANFHEMTLQKQPKQTKWTPTSLKATNQQHQPKVRVYSQSPVSSTPIGNPHSLFSPMDPTDKPTGILFPQPPTTTALNK